MWPYLVKDEAKPGGKSGLSLMGVMGPGVVERLCFLQSTLKVRRVACVIGCRVRCPWVSARESKGIGCKGRRANLCSTEVQSLESK